MITHKILKIEKNLTDGVVTGIFVQIEISDGTTALAFSTTLAADKDGQLKTAIEDWAAIQHKEFVKITEAKAAEVTEKARHTKVVVDKATVPIDSAVIATKADSIEVVADEEIKP